VGVGIYLNHYVDLLVGLPSQLCPLHICYTHWRIFFKIKKAVCRTHITTLQTGQCQIWGLHLIIRQFNVSYVHLIPIPWRIFFKLYWNVNLNMPLCRAHVTNLLAVGKGHIGGQRSNISYFKNLFFKGLSSNLAQNIAMSRTHAFSVQTQYQSHLLRSMYNTL
jgi:hypothetical protein